MDLDSNPAQRLAGRVLDRPDEGACGVIERQDKFYASSREVPGVLAADIQTGFFSFLTLLTVLAFFFLSLTTVFPFFASLTFAPGAGLSARGFFDLKG